VRHAFLPRGRVLWKALCKTEPYEFCPPSKSDNSKSCLFLLHGFLDKDGALKSGVDNHELTI